MHRQTARAIALLAVPTLAFALAGCGAEETAPAEETTTTTTTEPAETTEEESAATSIGLVWPDAAWEVESVEEDLCAGGGISPSAFSEQEDVFTCGPTAASALACLADEDGSVVCITDAASKRGVAFDSPTAVDPDAEHYDREGEAIPLYVDLLDGTRCQVISHDHSQHWNDLFSWYSCDDGSELLTEEEIAGTFDRDGELWSVQRSTDQQEPVEDQVARAFFAGV